MFLSFRIVYNSEIRLKKREYQNDVEFKVQIDVGYSQVFKLKEI